MLTDIEMQCALIVATSVMQTVINRTKSSPPQTNPSQSMNSSSSTSAAFSSSSSTTSSSPPLLETACDLLYDLFGMVEARVSKTVYYHMIVKEVMTQLSNLYVLWFIEERIKVSKDVAKQLEELKGEQNPVVSTNPFDSMTSTSSTSSSSSSPLSLLLLQLKHDQLQFRNFIADLPGFPSLDSSSSSSSLDLLHISLLEDLLTSDIDFLHLYFEPLHQQFGKEDEEDTMGVTGMGVIKMIVKLRTDWKKKQKEKALQQFKDSESANVQLQKQKAAAALNAETPSAATANLGKSIVPSTAPPSASATQISSSSSFLATSSFSNTRSDTISAASFLVPAVSPAFLLSQPRSSFDNSITSINPLMIQPDHFGIGNNQNANQKKNGVETTVTEAHAKKEEEGSAYGTVGKIQYHTTPTAPVMSTTENSQFDNIGVGAQVSFGSKDKRKKEDCTIS